MTNKTYILYWYDKDMKCTNRTVFDAKNKREAIKVAKEFIEQYGHDMEFLICMKNLIVGTQNQFL